MPRHRHPGTRRTLTVALALLPALPAASVARPLRPALAFGPALSQPAAAPAQAGARPAQAEIQRFGATVSRVRVDVIVTDDGGDFVTDLTAADFTVYEDGEPQPILDVQLVDLAAGEVHPLLGEGAAAAGDELVGAPPAGDVGAGGGAEAGTGGGAAAGSDPGAGDATGDLAANDAPDRSPADALGAVIFLIDGPSLSVQARARFGDAWNQLLADTEGLDVPRAAYMVDSTGQLQELAPLGYDLDTMRAAAETVRAAPFFGDMTRQRLIELAADLTDPFLGEAAQRLAAAKARGFEGQERSRSLASYELLTSFADALWTRSGRTAVVWVSSGIKLMQGGPYAMLVGNQRDAFSPDPMIHAAQEALHRAANGSNVSIYTVDPTLLVGTRMMGGDVGVATAGAANLLDTPEMQQSLDGLRDALRTAAAETGGESFIHATDLPAVLREIEEDTSRFYLITYAPPLPEGDGEYHEIRVEVGRDGTGVRARGGYVDHAAGERARRLVAAALALPGSVSDLPVRAQAFRSRRAPGVTNVLLAVAVEGGELGLMLTPEGERRVSLDVHAIVLDADQVIDESHEQLTARSSAGALSPPDRANPLSATPVGILAYRKEWSVPPGEHTINVAVLDNVSGRVGAASVQIDVPADDGAWGISDPLLVSIDGASRAQPVVVGRVVPEQALAVFVEVYGGVQPILSGQVLLASAAGAAEPEAAGAAGSGAAATEPAPSDPRIGEPQGARLFPFALRRVAAGVHRGSAPLPPGMPPGRYVVQLVITDPPAGQHRIVRLPIEVVAGAQR